MKKAIAVACLWFISGSIFADVVDFPLDKIALQLTSKQWVTTDSALVAAEINASLTQRDLSKARADIMDKLAKIAQGDWHIVQFNRSQDSSGLEKLFVSAEVRVSQSALNNLYQNAKKVSSPGATYTIATIDFKPSLAETERVKSQLRTRLYQMVNDEIARLNKVYSLQNYSLHRLYLVDGNVAPINPMMHEKQLLTLVRSAPNLSVSNEVTMHAFVEIANLRSTGANVVHP